jgi:hypothetical protein
VCEAWGTIIENVGLIKDIHCGSNTKTLWTINKHFKTEEQKCKTGPVRGEYHWEVRMERVKGGWIWSMYFICLYENKTKKPV